MTRHTDFEDDYPEGIANESFWHNKPAPSRAWDIFIVRLAWGSLITGIFGGVFVINRIIMGSWW